MPLVKKYCLECHSTKARKGSLDLERFASLRAGSQGLKPWQHIDRAARSRARCRPRTSRSRRAEERKQIIAWTRGFLDAEARARTGDPGDVPLRRLSNAEYDCTIRDLTGVDLRPTREFPADGAAGEGFTNAAESLSDISPALFTKYLNAAKDIAEHAVLLPDGFRFSPGKTPPRLDRRKHRPGCASSTRPMPAAMAGCRIQPYLQATRPAPRGPESPARSPWPRWPPRRS